MRSRRVYTSDEPPASRDRTLSDGVANSLEPLAELYDEHATRVFSLAARILGDVDEAEDIVQDVFLQSWQQRNRFDSTRGSPAAWLLMMTRSRAIDRLRVKRRSGDHWNLQAGDPTRAVVTPAPSNLDDLRCVGKAIASLPTGQQRVLELAFFEGYTHVEIARLLDEPLGTIKTRIRVGLERLRHALGTYCTGVSGARP